MNIAIIGAGGFAREVSSYLDEEATFFVDDEFAQPDSGIFPLSELDVKKYKILIAIGDPQLRAAILGRIPVGAAFHTLIHEKAYVGRNVRLGEGAIVCPGAVITTNVEIGCHAQCHNNSVIGHDCRIGNFLTLSPGGNISGENIIGERVYFGSNATSKQRVTIAADTTFGLNAGILSDVNQSGVYVGTPAKRIK